MNPFDHQRRHPILTVTLFIAMLAPDPFLVIIAGRILKAEIPNPNPRVLPAGVRRPRPVGSGRQIGSGGGDG